MNALEKSKEEFEFEQNQLERLSALGFKCQKPIQLEPNFFKVEYASSLFVFVIAWHSEKAEVYRMFKDARTGLIVPEPSLALEFFLPDYELVVADLKSRINEADLTKRAILLRVMFYLTFPWVLTTNDWVSDSEFCYALAKSNKWLYEQPRLIAALPEYTQKLRSYRTAKTRVF